MATICLTCGGQRGVGSVAFTDLFHIHFHILFYYYFFFFYFFAWCFYALLFCCFSKVKFHLHFSPPFCRKRTSELRVDADPIPIFFWSVLLSFYYLFVWFFSSSFRLMSLYLEVIDTFFHLVGPSALLLRRIFVDSVEIALEIFKKKKNRRIWSYFCIFNGQFQGSN